jgi:predicted enzyme related to lactoylglutathione lyase
MPTLNLVLLYVEDPARSSRFYEKLFKKAPVASSPAYVAFKLDNGLTLGLWSTRAPDFVSTGIGNLAEIAFIVKDDAEVDRLYGVTIEQPPAFAVFGLSFVALDPDQHRIRVCTPDN